MVLRAIFWIAVVSFFMPREPDLGYGRPGGDADGITNLITNAQTATADAAGACDDPAGMCAKGFSVVSMFQGMAVNSLSQVKADIEQSKHVRMEQLAQRD